MGNGNAKLYVGNLNYAASKEELTELFSAYGEVGEVHVLEGKGFGFVQLASDEEAAKAMESLNGQIFKGRALRIDIARPRQPGDRPRREYSPAGDRGRGGYHQGGGYADDRDPYSGRGNE